MSIFYMVLIFIVSALLIFMIALLLKTKREQNSSNRSLSRQRKRLRKSKVIAQTQTCPECGKLVHAQDLYCGECGSALTNATVEGDLIGSRWQLKDSSTVVTFLENGDIMFEFNKANLGRWKRSGKWSMKGDRLLFDCNKFSQYDVVMRDNRMTGTCTQVSSDGSDEHEETELVRISTDNTPKQQSDGTT